MSQRNLHFDFLKGLATFVVVWVHTAADVVIYAPDVGGHVWWAGNLADAIGRWGVPVFMMISGALLLSSPATADAAGFYRKRAARLLPPLVFWSVFFMGARLWADPHYRLATALADLASGAPYYHLWYLYTVLGLDLAAPLLRRVVTGVSPPVLRRLIVAGFVLAAVESLLRAAQDSNHTLFLSRFPPYIPYFLLGYYLFHLSSWRPQRFLLAIAAGCGVLVAVATAVLMPIFGPLCWEVTYSNLNPLVVVMSTCVFLYFIGRPPGARWVRSIAPLSLGIYLIHPLWLKALATFGIHGSLLHPLFGIPLTAMLAFALAALSTVFLQRLPLLRRTVS